MTRFSLAATYELVLALTVIVSACLGYYAPEIGMWLYSITDFG